MGNHEFCTECGASDFHHGRECDPKRKAEYEARNQKAIEEAVQRRNQDPVLVQFDALIELLPQDLRERQQKSINSLRIQILCLLANNEGNRTTLRNISEAMRSW
jgi:predicted  nucleic acid-binding Zn-ribbon protein